MAQLWALGKALHPFEPSVSDSVKGEEEGELVETSIVFVTTSQTNTVILKILTR